MQAEAAEAARRQAQKEAELRNGPPPDFDAEEDAETRKARAWDDWKVRLGARFVVAAILLKRWLVNTVMRVT